MDTPSLPKDAKDFLEATKIKLTIKKGDAGWGRKSETPLTKKRHKIAKASKRINRRRTKAHKRRVRKQKAKGTNQ